MRRLIFSVMASTVAFMAFTQARAADIVDEVPAAPAADYSQPVAGNWSGAYVGGAGSLQWGKFTPSTERAIGGQLYGGFNMQNNQLVYGAEADIGYSGNENVSGGVTTKQGFNGSVRGRLGYDLNPVLVYGTAGLAVGNVKAKDATSEVNNTLYGWTAGAGGEVMVTDSISARLEYRYTDFANKDYGLTSGTVSRGYDEHSVKVGLGVKF